MAAPAYICASIRTLAVQTFTSNMPFTVHQLLERLCNAQLWVEDMNTPFVVPAGVWRAEDSSWSTPRSHLEQFILAFCHDGDRSWMTKPKLFRVPGSTDERGAYIIFLRNANATRALRVYRLVFRHTAGGWELCEREGMVALQEAVDGSDQVAQLEGQWYDRFWMHSPRPDDSTIRERSEAGIDYLRSLLRLDRACAGAIWVPTEPITTAGVVRVIQDVYRQRPRFGMDGEVLCHLECSLHSDPDRWPDTFDLAWAVSEALGPDHDVRLEPMALNFGLPHGFYVLPRQGAGLCCLVTVDRFYNGSAIAVRLARSGSLNLAGYSLENDWRALPALMLSHPRLGEHALGGCLSCDALRLVVHLLMRGSPPPPLVVENVPRCYKGPPCI